MKSLIIIILAFSFPAVLKLHSQNMNWSVHAQVSYKHNKVIDACSITYRVFPTDTTNTHDADGTFSVPIYKGIDYNLALRLQNLHSKDGYNQPDYVVKFTACKKTENQSRKVGGIWNKVKIKVKQEIHDKGVLYWTCQGAKGLSASGIIKDEKINDALRTIGRIKIRIPIGSKKQSHKSMDMTRAEGI